MATWPGRSLKGRFLCLVVLGILVCFIFISVPLNSVTISRVLDSAIPGVIVKKASTDRQRNMTFESTDASNTARTQLIGTAIGNGPLGIYSSRPKKIDDIARSNLTERNIAKLLRLDAVSKRFMSISDNMQYRKRVYNEFYKPIKPSANVSCERIVEGDDDKINDAKKMSEKLRRKVVDQEYYVNISNCNTFKNERGYINHPLTIAERDFPLAFGIVVYKDVELAERLFRSIYRPHNYYCFHVDNKADKIAKLAFAKIAFCFDNAFVVPNPVDVHWGKISVLQAELRCMQHLWSAKSWKYYINLTGHEFPLKTNLEIVKILEALDGANIAQAKHHKTITEFEFRWKPHGTPPHNITPFVGSVHAVLNRDFVNFSIHDTRSFDFQKYLIKTYIPDELFFSSLNHNPHLGIPGTFTGEGEEYPKKPFFLRYKNWSKGSAIYPRKCYGKWQRYVCILGVGDIHKAVNDIGLFANKFVLDFEPLGLECLESWLYEKTWRQYLSNETIDVSYYKHLDQVKYQYRPGQKYHTAYS